MAETINLGTVTAYGAAVEGGYTGTYNDFKQHMADFANIADEIEEGLSSKADLINGKVPSSELPSYVDDVIEGYYKIDDGKFYEESTYETEIIGESGKIYVDLSTNDSYRWSGSTYVKINDVDVSGKADKVTSATNGNFAGLDSNGNLIDSGMAPTEIQEKTLTTDKRRVNIDLNTITTPGIYFVTRTDSGNYHYPDSLPANYNRGTLTVINYKDGDTDMCRQEFSMQECLYYRLGVLSGEYQGWNYWFEVSGGAGGHEILDGSGSTMNQRSKLQFDGATVTDDSANDKTIVKTTPQSMIGDAWASGQAYAVGDYRIDGNVLYKCKTAHTSTASNRPPYASYWDATTVLNGIESGGVTEEEFEELEKRVEILEATIKPAIVTILKGSTRPSITVTRNTSYFNYSYSNNILLFKATGLSTSAGFFINHDFSQYLGLGYKLVIKYGVASSGSNITSVSDTTTNMTVYHSYGSADQSTDTTGRQALIATDAMKQAIINGTSVSERQYLILPIDSFFTAYYKYLLFWMGSWGTKYMTWAIEEIYIVN